ncbi:hypothetical protein R69746_08054 [Paraburkholderia aspalathi]|uniref:GNAT family N-acetyltransferase n=1 Tax=Paraburkholderia aspalathi TaxID=1324617 RepID=UPI00190A1406|nr:GNAT family N-acetyltransferase [Paraburkholderia aspalathi]MBK3844019.1 GNAT family N-acetyltransferase [Paraburkholderia aspalathi]CAE6865288.1 hypothetical protein R69746_08054 [Paraburkholderia aspalathi]CAE6867208.1 hypothetical protein R75465_08041 [Paraburkholderia aspalathi]
MNTFEFRKLQVTDLPTYYEIRFSVTENLIHEHQVKYLQREWALSDIAQGGGWLCFEGAVAVGLCLPLFVPDPIVAALFVRPEYHGRGIGRKLLELSIDWLRGNGAQNITLETDSGTRADGFYKHLGWKRGDPSDQGGQVSFTLDLSTICEAT